MYFGGICVSFLPCDAMLSALYAVIVCLSGTLWYNQNG